MTQQPRVAQLCRAGLLAVAAAAAVLPLGGCKPAEKHYRSAYDAAQAKRQAAAAAEADALADADGVIGATALEQVDGPRRRSVNGRELMVLTEPVSGDGAGTLGVCNVAVGVYSMDTNAKAMADALRAEGYAAFTARNGNGRHYVVAAVCETLGEASDAVGEFVERHPGWPYSGLQGQPLVLLR